MTVETLEMTAGTLAMTAGMTLISEGEMILISVGTMTLAGTTSETSRREVHRVETREVFPNSRVVGYGLVKHM